MPHVCMICHVAPRTTHGHCMYVVHVHVQGFILDFFLGGEEKIVWVWWVWGV